jgi:hypothetical protein
VRGGREMAAGQQSACLVSSCRAPPVACSWRHACIQRHACMGACRDL